MLFINSDLNKQALALEVKILRTTKSYHSQMRVAKFMMLCIIILIIQ